MNIFGRLLDPFVLLSFNLLWHVAVLWLLWRLVRALERRAI
jgi:hypothetical protein